MKPYPPVSGNTVRWIEGPEYYNRLLAALDSAQHTILFETYYCRDGEIFRSVMNALVRAAERGVRVYVMLDAVGSAPVLRLASRMLLRHSCHLRIFNPLRLSPWYSNLRRNHRKMCLVDGRLLLTGGWGLADEWAGLKGQGLGMGFWMDAGVEVDGPVTAHWSDLFARTWRRCGGEVETMRPVAGDSGTSVCRLAFSQGRQRQDLFRSLLQRVRKARERVWIVTPYFVTSRRLRRALRHAAWRGVDVCVLVPGPYNDHPAVRYAAWQHISKLIRRGVRVYEYAPSFIHAKVVIVDDWASVGSCNLDHWTQMLALEANQEVWDRAFARQAAERVSGWLRSAQRLDRDPLAQAPLWVRWLARLIASVERTLYQFWVA